MAIRREDIEIFNRPSLRQEYQSTIRRIIEPVYANPDKTDTFNTEAVTVTDVATLIKASNSDRIAIYIQNIDIANPVYLGNDLVLTANGIRVGAGSDVRIDYTTAAIYGICGTGLTASLRVVEY